MRFDSNARALTATLSAFNSMQLLLEVHLVRMPSLVILLTSIQKDELIKEDVEMALTFKQMVATARENVPGLSAAEARAKIQANPNTLVIDVQDAADAGACGLIPSSLNISLGMLPIRADLELPERLRNPELADRNRPVLVTCGAGGQAALGAYILKEMGFTDVGFIDGGTAAWKEAGFEVEA